MDIGVPSDDPRHPLNFRIEKLNMLKKRPPSYGFLFLGGGGGARLWYGWFNLDGSVIVVFEFSFSLIRWPYSAFIFAFAVFKVTCSVMALSYWNNCRVMQSKAVVHWQIAIGWRWWKETTLLHSGKKSFDSSIQDIILITYGYIYPCAHSSSILFYFWLFFSLSNLISNRRDSTERNQTGSIGRNGDGEVEKKMIKIIQPIYAMCRCGNQAEIKSTVPASTTVHF